LAVLWVVLYIYISLYVNGLFCGSNQFQWIIKVMF
jgi:hypothetical protein